MRRCVMLTVSLTLVALLAGLPRTARAYYLESRSLPGCEPTAVAYDTTAPVEFRIATNTIPESDGDVGAAIEAAFATWGGVECSSLSFARGEDVSTPDPYHWMIDEGRYVLVYFSDDPAIWDVPKVGFFLFAHDGCGGLVGATIVLNSLNHAWSTTGAEDVLDVQSIVTALLGRSLGITSMEEGNATYPIYRAGDITKRTLGADETAGLQFLYGDPAVCMPEPPDAMCTGAVGEICPPPVMGENPGTGTRPPPGTEPPPTEDPPGTDPPGTDPPGTDPPGTDPMSGGGCSAGGPFDSPAAGLLLMLCGIFLILRRRWR